MGRIDLDPASHRIPQRWIQAKRAFNKEDDGLSKPWRGRVFLNPPYGKTGNRSNQGIWTKYAIEQIELGNVEQIIVLTKTVPGYQWWDFLFNGGWPGYVCITEGRLSFVKPDWVTGKGIEWPSRSHKSKAASSFWYFGDNSKRFAEVFGLHGRIIEIKEDKWYRG